MIVFVLISWVPEMMHLPAASRDVHRHGGFHVSGTVTEFASLIASWHARASVKFFTSLHERQPSSYLARGCMWSVLTMCQCKS